MNKTGIVPAFLYSCCVYMGWAGDPEGRFMQTINRSYKVYDFDELSEDVKKKVLDDFRDFETDLDSWYEPITEDAENHLEGLGYMNPKIFFSGFWSQGDGACFEATVDIQAWLKAHKMVNKYKMLFVHAEEVKLVLKHVGHYYHENSMVIETENYAYGNDKVDEQLTEVEILVKEEAKDESKEIYRNLEKYYEGLREDELIREDIIANDFQFLEDGTPFNTIHE